MGSRRLALGLHQRDRDVLERFQRAVGCGSIDSNGGVMLQWRTYRWAEIEPLLLRMMPMLSARRREQADALLARPKRRAA